MIIGGYIADYNIRRVQNAPILQFARPLSPGVSPINARINISGREVYILAIYNSLKQRTKICVRE